MSGVCCLAFVRDCMSGPYDRVGNKWFENSVFPEDSGVHLRRKPMDSKSGASSVKQRWCVPVIAVKLTRYPEMV